MPCLLACLPGIQENEAVKNTVSYDVIFYVKVKLLLLAREQRLRVLVVAVRPGWVGLSSPPQPLDRKSDQLSSLLLPQGLKTMTVDHFELSRLWHRPAGPRPVTSRSQK